MRNKILKLLMIFSIMVTFVAVELTATETYAAELEPISLIPAMTSNTAPSGVASASSFYNDGYALPTYRAFDGIQNYSVGGNYTAWGTNSTTGWLAYQFETPKVVKKYVMYYGNADTTGFPSTQSLPASWTFEGSANGTEWTILDSIEDHTWGVVGPYTFEIANNTAYTSYRINITKNNGSTTNKVNLTIHEMEMWGYDASEVPEQPTSDRAILTITMTNGLEKEYDLSMDKVSNFIDWYESKDAGIGSAIYKFNKDWNTGPFLTRTEYVIFDKILTFNVDEY